MVRGHLREIFSSFQGEGLEVGYRQIFIRFAGCNLRCRYCDTPTCQEGAGPCRIQRCPDAMSSQTVTHPLSVDEVLSAVEALDLSLHHSVSFTGGEPLLQLDFLQPLAAVLKERKVRILLETNGTLPDQLQLCQDRIDVIAMDWKLPSSTGQQDQAALHARFFRQAMRQPLFVKMVITAGTVPAEVERACRWIAAVRPETAVVLQPVTGCGGLEPPDFQGLVEYHALAVRYLSEVRVIPQMHRLIDAP